MKKVKIALLLLIATVFILPACKKGKDDPFITLHSRDGRLMKTWKLTTITGKDNNDAVTYDGSSLSVAGTVTYVNATFQMTFDKNGAFSYTETKTMNFSGATASTETNKSYWYWGNSNKNKDFLICSPDLFSYGSSEFYVDELKASTLVLECDNESSTNTTNLIFTFTKQ